MKMFRDYDHECEHAIIVSSELINMSDPEDYTATTAIDGELFINKFTPEWNNYILLF
jgi:hypothetical protein